jgi:hypothetical protein
MSSFEIVKATNLSQGEFAWEVMEQSQLYGEKPVRLVFSGECLRTVTSLALTKPKQYKEFWRVPSAQIIKVSWCPDLCVLYVVFLITPDSTQQTTKVFFAEHLVGKRMIQQYKKIKPASVQLSPGRKSKTSKKVTTISDANGNEPNASLLTTSFRLKICLNQEKFWRALIVMEYTVCREIFFGISPSVIRIITPETLDAELAVSLICVSDFKFYTYLGSPTIVLKYFQDVNNSKVKKIKFHVLPVTAQEMLRWYEFCQNFGELNALTTPLPIQKPDLEDLPSNENVPLKNDQNDKNNLLRIKSADIIPLTNTTNKLSPSSLPHPFKVATKRKESKSVTKITNENEPLYYTHKGSRFPTLKKSTSFLHPGTRV